MKNLFMLVTSTFIIANEYTLMSQMMIEGVESSILGHVIYRQQKKYKKSVFHKYIRLYKVQNNNNSNHEKKSYTCTRVKRSLLTDFEYECLRKINYFIFASRPLEGIRPIICLICGVNNTAPSSLLNVIKIKINKKIFNREIKLFTSNPEAFQQRHYLECFDTFTQADRDAAWKATEKTRKMLKWMMNQ